MLARTIQDACEYFGGETDGEKGAAEYTRDKYGVDSKEHKELCELWVKFCKTIALSYPIGELVEKKFDEIKLNKKTQKAYNEVLLWVAENIPDFDTNRGEVVQ